MADTRFKKGQQAHNKQEDVDHGHHLMYNRGCRCTPCKGAWTVHRAEQLGYLTLDQRRSLPCSECGQEEKLPGKSIGRLCRNEKARVQMNTRNRILTPEQYDEMFEWQGGVCAVCFKPEKAKRNGKTKQLAEDHLHGTKTVRGLVCQDHNTGIGLFGDDPDLLEAAAFYLRRHDV